MSPAIEPFAQPKVPRAGRLASLSLGFLLDEVANGVAGLKSLDALLVLAINQANITPLTRDPRARVRYGHLDAPAPDDERRPVSINSVATSLGIPFETVRRRVRRMASEGVCALSEDGVVVPASFLGSPAYLQSAFMAHERMRDFYFELRAAGLVGALPGSNYLPGDGVPVRGAVRLLADYVLRTSEGLMREADNVISAIMLLMLLAAAARSADEAPGRPHRPIPLKTIAQRVGLPSETVRRHGLQLAERGLCVRAQTGLVLTPLILARPGLQVLLAENATNVQRLLAGLAERGVIAAWEKAEVDAGRAAS